MAFGAFIHVGNKDDITFIMRLPWLKATKPVLSLSTPALKLKKRAAPAGAAF
jgi:hypothetical protein